MAQSSRKHRRDLLFYGNSSTWPERCDVQQSVIYIVVNTVNDTSQMECEGGGNLMVGFIFQVEEDPLILCMQVYSVYSPAC